MVFDEKCPVCHSHPVLGKPFLSVAEMNMFDFPLLVLKGIKFTTGHIFLFFPGAGGEKANGRCSLGETREAIHGETASWLPAQHGDWKHWVLDLDFNE